MAASFLAGLSYAEHFTSVLGLFIRPIQSEFGWSRSVIAGIHTTGRLIEAIITPVVGSWLDRYGPRLMMPIGGIIVSAGMLSVTQIDSLWEFYLYRGLLVAVGFSLMGYLVMDVTIMKWFTLKRGRALAVSHISGNISNIVTIPLSVFVIAAYGWRSMFLVFGVATCLLVPIPSAILMRRRPEDLGLHPDGIDPSGADGADPTEKGPTDEKPPDLEPLWNRREVLMTRTFWLISACFAINSIAFQGINMSLAPYIQDLGHSDILLAAVTTFRSITMATSTIIMGFIAERAHNKSIRLLPFMMQSAAVFFFLLGRNPIFLWLGVLLYACGASGTYLVQEIIWVNCFGRVNLGLVRSLGYSITFGFGALGPIGINAVFDIFGSYHLAFLTIIGLLCLAGIMVSAVKPPKASRYARKGTG
ncbi:MAG: MFS transporter [Desulfobacterales bacterium]|nr:MFS transporter [Desulfobacterales bacterium]